MKRANALRLFVVVSVIAFAGIYGPSASAAVSAENLKGTLEPQDLAEALAGDVVEVSDVVFYGDDAAAGKFTSDTDTIGLTTGVVLGSGGVEKVAGPNSTDFTSRANGRIGDDDIDALTGAESRDAAILEFDFLPKGDHVSIKFVFASEEYSEWVGSEYNDTVALFINGQNCALVGTDPVSVNTINEADTPALFRENEFIDEDTPSPIDTEMDGLSTVLTCESDVDLFGPNHLKLVIADVSDSSIDGAALDMNRDSNVFAATAEWSGGFFDLPPCEEDGLQLLDGTGIVSGVVHDQLEPVIGQILPELQAPVHDLNCSLIVFHEDLIDRFL